MRPDGSGYRRRVCATGSGEAPDISDATGAAEALLGLPGFRVLEAEETPAEVVVVVELVAEIVGCPGCGVAARSHGRSAVDHRDLAAFGRPARLR